MKRAHDYLIDEVEALSGLSPAPTKYTRASDVMRSNIRNSDFSGYELKSATNTYDFSL